MAYSSCSITVYEMNEALNIFIEIEEQEKSALSLLAKAKRET